MNKKKILLIFGTRPEAIKMAPLYYEIKKSKCFNVEVCVTAQHRELLDQVLDIFNIKPRWDLDLMVSNQKISNLVANIIQNLDVILDDYKPDMVLIHGDTATTLAASVTCFLKKIKLSHVEAGLRTYKKRSPFPEEYNRRCASLSADWHFAPTEKNVKNLINEGIPKDKIHVTGNTVIDALFLTLSEFESDQKKFCKLKRKIDTRLDFDIDKKKFILITGHRRENFGNGFKNICEAIRELAFEHEDIYFIYPVHFNPNVKIPVNKILGNVKNIKIIEPMDYQSFIYLLSKCYLVLTDSGGIQEEAPSLGKPVIVMRADTERPEALESGTVMLSGAEKNKIINSVSNILEDKLIYKKMSMAHNPYGDGRASKKIVRQLKKIMYEE